MKNKCKNVKKNSPTVCRHWMVDYNVSRDRLSQRFVGNHSAMERFSGIYATYSKLLTVESDLVAPRLLISGSVSSGKTTAVGEFVKLMKVPHVTVSAASLVPEGYRGSNLSAAIKGLIAQAGSVDRLERHGGVLHVDEIDKWVLRKSNDKFYENLIYNLFGVLGGETIQIDGDEWDSSGVQLSTKKIMVVVSGAFSWLSTSNFKSSGKAMSALVRVGFPEEFMSRLTDHIHMETLDRNQINTFIANETTKLSECFSAGKYKPSLDSKAVNEISKQVIKNKLGLRSARRLIGERLYEQSKAQKDISI